MDIREGALVSYPMHSHKYACQIGMFVNDTPRSCLEDQEVTRK